MSTCCLRCAVLDSSGSGYASVLCDLFGSTADTVHVSVFGGFWLHFHAFPCEGGPRILRSILGQTRIFYEPSYSAVTGSVSLPREVYRKLWIYWEMTSGIFSITGMLRSTVVARQSTEPLWPSYPAGTCLVLYAEECTKVRIFCEFTSRVVSACSAYWLDSGYMYGVSLRVLRSHLALGTRTLFLQPLVPSRRLKSARRGFFWKIIPDMFPFSALFGSTADTCLRQCASLWASLFGNRDRYAQCKLCLQFFCGRWWLRNSWFDSGYMCCVSWGLHVPFSL